MDYSVIDVETTGLTPWTERILEIAVLTLTPDGETTGTWSTLVNPGRPVGATFIHGITDDSVADAPTFSEALPSLVDRLAGTIIVGHNVSFDLEFLNAEFKRSLYPVGIPRSAAVCTMDQSRIYLPPGRHSLAACVDRAGIAISPTHRAIDDARCSAALLAHYLQAETAGQRCADEARDRDGRVVLPAEWKRAAGAARSLDWLEVADLSSL